MSDDVSKTGRPAIPMGPTARTVAMNVRRLRKEASLSVYALSARLRELGCAISPSAITKIEKCVSCDGGRQTRRVDVDDLMALAVTLHVSPSALLLPLDDDSTHRVEVTGAGSVDAEDAWDWMDGKRPLKATPDFEPRMSDERMNYLLRSRPPQRRHKEL